MPGVPEPFPVLEHLQAADLPDLLHALHHRQQVGVLKVQPRACGNALAGLADLPVQQIAGLSLVELAGYLRVGSISCTVMRS